MSRLKSFSGVEFVYWGKSRFSFIFFIAFLSAVFLSPEHSSASQYKAASKAAPPNFTSLGCKKGEFWDPINGGECWSCSGKARTIFPVTGTKACEAPARELLRSATRKSKDRFSCSGGSFFDPRKGGECWKCPTGYDRSAAAVTASDACTKLISRVNKKATYSYNTGSVTKACKSGTFANFGSTKCYKCPTGYKHDGAKTVETSGVCYKAAYTAKKSATKTKSFSGFRCPSGQFFDAVNNGSCWSCASGYKRTGHAVNSTKACSKAVAASFSRATKKSAKKLSVARVTAIGCKKGTFFDIVDGGSCWKCPSSHSTRTLFHVKSKQACASKACGKINGRPCYVWERYPSCGTGLIEDPFMNKCVKPKDIACEATIEVIKALKGLTEEAQRAGKAIQDDAIDAIPGARAVLRFIENQGKQLQQQQKKLMKQVNLSALTEQFKALAVESPDEIRKMAEIAETVVNARSRIMNVFLNPKIICSGDGNKIAKAFEQTGLSSMFASLDPSIWQMLNPISSAHAAKGKPVHRMSFALGITPPLPGHLSGFSIGMNFTTDFKDNHSLALPTISYKKNITNSESGNDQSVFDVSSVVSQAKVGLGIGWSYWDGVTNWGANDVFNWGASLGVFGPIRLNIGAGGFGGISFSPVAGQYTKKTVTDLFGVTTVTSSTQPKLASFSLKLDGAIGGGFKIPLK